MTHDFLRKIEHMHSQGHHACVAYIHEQVEVFRSDSTRIDRLNSNSIIGVYNAKADKNDIIEDVLFHIGEYEKAKAEQSKRLAESLGMVG